MVHSSKSAGRSDDSAVLFARAIGHHQAGQLADAARLYRRILGADPRHFRSLYYLGVVAMQTGQPQAAVDSMSKALAVNDTVPEVHYNLALALQALGRLPDAAARYDRAIALNPAYAEALTNLGNVEFQLGRFADALSRYQRVVQLQGPSVISHFNIANALARLGRADEAEAGYRAAIALQPDFAEAHNNFGNLFREAGRLDEAEAAYGRAIALRPDYAEAHNNIGVILTARHALDQATRHFREAVRLAPGFADGHANLGAVLELRGEWDAALAEFQQAAALKPGDLDAVHRLARCLLVLGYATDAVALLKRALDGKGDIETRRLFARCIQALPIETLEGMRGDVMRALVEGWGAGTGVEHIAVALIKRNPAIAPLLPGAGSQPVGDPTAPAPPAGTPLPSPAIAALAGDELLYELMISARVCDPDLEILLTAARRALLAATRDANTPDSETLRFNCALARQCFINDYIYADSPEERDEVERLVGSLAATLQSGSDVTPLWPVAVAAYRPLHVLPGADLLVGRSWATPLRELLGQQIVEPRDEQAIRAQVPVVTAIDDEISRKVQAQYEENPYPRWVLPPPVARPLTVNDYFQAKFPRAPYRPMPHSDAPDILIAGCGTGAHAVQSFQEFAGAHVLAIDLSRASLAYATRKTRALGLPIEYAQADILKLGALTRRFDVIEAAGSLQCLEDPAAGWRVLLSLLKPGGVMILGLYSKLARAEVNAVRAYIAAHRYGGTAAHIRQCRQELLAFADGRPEKTVTRLSDFYTMSECRDLLFHVQEYQHTIPEIEAFLAGEDLQFLGFDIDARVLRRYGEENPGDAAMTDLGAWHRFECAHPHAFIGMYQFAVQKR